MEVWYLVIGIGVLLLLTGIINNIAEAIDRRQAQKKVQILRYQRRIDEITEYIDQLKGIDIPGEIISLLQDEVIARFDKIKQIDPKFDGTHELFKQAKENEENHPPQETVEMVDFNQLNEHQFLDKITLLRGLGRFIQEIPLLSLSSNAKRHKFEDSLIAYRFDKIHAFYTRLAQQAIEKENYDTALQNLEKILGPLQLLQHENAQLNDIRDQALELSRHAKSLKMQHIEKLREEKIEKEKQEKARREAARYNT